MRSPLRKSPYTTSGIKIKRNPQSQNEESGSITIDLAPSHNSHITLRKLLRPHSYKASVSEFSSFNAALNGPIQLIPSRYPKVERTFESPQNAIVHARSENVDLDLLLTEESRAIVAQEMPIQRLEFFREKSAPIERQGAPTLFESSILSGNIYLEDINSEVITLRPAEYIQFDSLDGFIRSIELSEDHMRVQYSGRVWGLKSGTPEKTRSLMPTRLQSIQAQQGFALFLGTCITFISLFMAILTWLNIRW